MNYIRFIIFCIGLFFIAPITLAQRTSNSPYTEIGIGYLEQNPMVQNFAMGGLSYAMVSSLNINPSNPASYSSLSLTSFEAAVRSRGVQMTSNGQTQQVNNSYFSHLALGFPVSKRVGMSFGLLPMSTRGYSYELISESSDNIGTIQKLYEGEGGISRFFMGVGVQVNDRLSVGMNGSYIFGKIQGAENVVFVDQGTFMNTRALSRTTLGDFGMDFSANYLFKLKEKRFIRLGVAYTPFNSVNSSNTNLVENYKGNTNFPQIKDTASLVQDGKFQTELAEKYGFGVLYRTKSQWLLGIDADYSPWSNVNTLGDLAYGDAMNIRFGGQKDFDKKIVFRFGARYGQLYYLLNSESDNIENEQIEEMAVSVGMAIPIKRSFTSLDFGIEFGTRGKDAPGLIKEEFVHVNFGISINDRWFIKRKYE